MMKPRLLEQILGPDRPDPGCEACFEVLDQYAEALVRGEDFASRFPQVVTHLQLCDACREDTEAFLEILRSELLQSNK